MSTAQPAEQKLEPVTLQKDHTHGGVTYKSGTVIRVNAADKDWLMAQSIIAGGTAPAAAPTKE